MDHWHRCKRWNRKGWDCPFATAPRHKEKEDEDAEGDDILVQRQHTRRDMHIWFQMSLQHLRRRVPRVIVRHLRQPQQVYHSLLDYILDILDPRPLILRRCVVHDQTLVVQRQRGGCCQCKTLTPGRVTMIYGMPWCQRIQM